MQDRQRFIKRSAAGEEIVLKNLQCEHTRPAPQPLQNSRKLRARCPRQRAVVHDGAGFNAHAVDVDNAAVHQPLVNHRQRVDPGLPEVAYVQRARDGERRKERQQMLRRVALEILQRDQLRIARPFRHLR